MQKPLLRYNKIDLRFNGHKLTHKIRLKNPMGKGMVNPVTMELRRKNPVR